MIKFINNWQLILTSDSSFKQDIKALVFAIRKIATYQTYDAKILVGCFGGYSSKKTLKKFLDEFDVQNVCFETFNGKSRLEFRKQVKERLCTLGLFLDEVNGTKIVKIIGANGFKLHAEQCSYLKYFVAFQHDKD